MDSAIFGIRNCSIVPKNEAIVMHRGPIIIVNKLQPHCPKKTTIPVELSQIIHHLFDSESVFDSRGLSILVNTHKIMRKEKQMEASLVRIRKFGHSLYA